MLNTSDTLFVGKGGLVLRKPISKLSTVWYAVFGVTQVNTAGVLEWTWIHKPKNLDDIKPFNLNKFMDDNKDDLNGFGDEFGDDFSWNGDE